MDSSKLEAGTEVNVDGKGLADSRLDGKYEAIVIDSWFDLGSDQVAVRFEPWIEGF